MAENRKLCVIGDPVEHSKSPLLQNAMIEALGLPYTYGAVRVARGETAAWLRRAKEEGYAGFNATMPHKVDLIPLMDELGEDARRFGAVNTVCLRPDGSAVGHNTDGRGFLRALLDLGVEPKGKTVCLLGAGGAAKAVALKLAEEGARQILVCNRTAEKAAALCASEPSVMAPRGFSRLELTEAAEESDLVVNCTSLGMTGTAGRFEDLSFLSALREGGAVFDLIYSPAETALLREARRLGHRAANGLGMLLYQAVYALEHFTGEHIDDAAMGRLLKDVMA